MNYIGIYSDSICFTLVFVLLEGHIISGWLNKLSKKEDNWSRKLLLLKYLRPCNNNLMVLLLSRKFK